MRGNGGSGGSTTGGSQTSGVQSLSEREIKKNMRSDATQHPVTILPFTLSILMLIVYLVFPPFLGPVWAIILFIVFGTLAAGTYFWRYSLRFNQLYESKVQAIMAVMEQESSMGEEEELNQLQETLKAGFANLNTNEGLKALSQLNDVYDRLQPILESKRVTDPMSVAHIPTLAEETYKQGLSVLADSLGLMTAIHSPTNERLETEIVDTKKQLENESQPERVKMLDERLASHQERLDLVKQQQLRVDQLLHQCESCEASLHRTRLDVAGFRADTAESRVRDLTDTLRNTINQAKEVQEELKRLGY